MTYLMIEAALRALILAALVGLGLKVLRVRNVPARKTAWSMVLIASLAMPLLMRWPAGFVRRYAWVVPIPASQNAVPHKNAAPPSAMLLVSSSGASHRFPHPGHSVDRWSPEKKTIAAPLIDAAPDAFSGSASGSPQWPPLARLAVWIYLAVAGALLLRLAYATLTALHLWVTAKPVSPLVAPEGFVRTSARIASPVAIGSGVVLPPDYNQWTPRKRRMVLAHELSHVRQMDFYLQLLASLYAVAFWFSPLGWLLRRTLASLGERIADRAGMEAGQTRSGYAELVLEFAAMPRRNLRGVAMARRGNLTHRIESLLNDTVFRHAFTEGRRRAAVALLLVPFAIFAVAALVRVPVAAAAVGECSQAAAPDGNRVQASGRQVVWAAGSQVQPEKPVLVARLAPLQTPAPAPQPKPSPMQQTAPQTAPAAEPQPPAPPSGPGVRFGSDSRMGEPLLNTEPWAIVNGPEGSPQRSFSGHWGEETRQQIQAARRAAHGPALWFRHDGRSYLLEDPSVVARIEQMQKPMEALGRQQEALGRQQEAFGRQMEALARDQQLNLRVRLPDFSKEMADLQSQIGKMKLDQGAWNDQKLAELGAELKAKRGELLSPEKMGEIQQKVAEAQAQLTSERMAELQAKFAQLEARLGALQAQMGRQQGAFGEKMGALGAQQGKLGAQQGRLGAEQGRLAIETQREVQNIIEQALRDGRAKRLP